MRVHVCAREVCAARNNGKSVRARGALTRVAALQRDVGRHRHERDAGGEGRAQGKRGMRRRQQRRRQRRRRLSGSWVSGNVRCRDIRQPLPLSPLSPSRAFLDPPNHPFPCGARTPPPPPAPPPLTVLPALPPATEPDRRTTGSSSSSPLIRLSRYRHRRPGNPLPPPAAANAAVAPSPRGPLLRFWLTADPLSSDPRGRIQPRYPYPPDCHT